MRSSASSSASSRASSGEASRASVLLTEMNTTRSQNSEDEVGIQTPHAQAVRENAVLMCDFIIKYITEIQIAFTMIRYKYCTSCSNKR